MASSRIALVTALAPGAADEVEPGTGVLTLASILRPHYDTSVIELNLLWNQAGRNSDSFLETAADAVIATQADVIGFGSICGTYPSSIRLSQRVAEGLPQARLIFGGPHASVVDVRTLEAFPWIETVVRGEADDTLPRWIDAVCAGRSVEDIPGITFRKDGRVQKNCNAPVPLDLDSIPLPAFDLHPGIEDLAALPLEIGRGCPFACTFCSTNDFFRRRFRLKSAACTVAQMQFLHAKYGVRRFDLIHDMFTVNRSKVLEFCDQVRNSGEEFTWSCSARTDCVDAEMLEQMRDAGCQGIFFGIETGSKRLQSLIDKGLDLGHAKRMIELCDALGIKTTSSLIAGYPTETMEDFRDTVRFLTHASHLRQVHPQIHILSPLPETPLTDQFWDQIYFDENGIDDAESGMMQDCEDRRLIAEHKDIFSNFYAFPCPIDRHYLRRAAGFFTYGWLKCSGLMQALHQRAGDMLKIFDLWDRSHRDKNPAYFETWEFATDLVDFAEREFGSEEDPALLVTTRFYRAFRESFDAVRPTLLPDAEQRLTLSPGVILVTVRGDIVRVLGDLQKQRKPSPECVDRIATVVVRSRSEAECRISELPAISSVVLSHAQRGATISDIVAEFHRREIRFGPLTPSEVARHAINKLEADCLICRIPAAQVVEATLATQ